MNYLYFSVIIVALMLMAAGCAQEPSLKRTCYKVKGSFYMVNDSGDVYCASPVGKE